MCIKSFTLIIYAWVTGSWSYVLIQFHSPECSVIFLPDFLNSIKIKDSFNQDELNCKEVRQLRLQAVEFQSFWRNNFVYTLGQWLGLTRAICVDQGISSSQIFSYGNGFSLLGYIILNVYWKKIEIITKTTKSVQCDSVCVTKCISFRHGKPIKIYLQWSWFISMLAFIEFTLNIMSSKLPCYLKSCLCYH